VGGRLLVVAATPCGPTAEGASIWLGKAGRRCGDGEAKVEGDGENVDKSGGEKKVVVVVVVLLVLVIVVVETGGLLSEINSS
jgi:hypothetical protein